jgi:hypothetical protein
MPSRTRISPQQLRLIQLAANSPWGFDQNDVYHDVLKLPLRWRRKDPVPATVRASIHRSLTKLLKGRYLHRAVSGTGHEQRRWKLTIKGKALAEAHGFEITYPDPVKCTSPDVTARIQTWCPVYVE